MCSQSENADVQSASGAVGRAGGGGKAPVHPLQPPAQRGHRRVPPLRERKSAGRGGAAAVPQGALLPGRRSRLPRLHLQNQALRAQVLRQVFALQHDKQVRYGRRGLRVPAGRLRPGHPRAQHGQRQSRALRLHLRRTQLQSRQIQVRNLFSNVYLLMWCKISIWSVELFCSLKNIKFHIFILCSEQLKILSFKSGVLFNLSSLMKLCVKKLQLCL